jgi:hypothetical protein
VAFSRKNCNPIKPCFVCGELENSKAEWIITPKKMISSFFLLSKTQQTSRFHYFLKIEKSQVDENTRLRI